MKIETRVIPHRDQRYSTVGDWWVDDHDVLQIRSSQLAGIHFELAVISHEILEALLCLAQGITSKQVDKFDLEYIRAGLLGEPGDEPDAPYHRQHVTASICERAIAQCLGINWNTYASAIDALPIEVDIL